MLCDMKALICFLYSCRWVFDANLLFNLPYAIKVTIN